MSDIIKNHSNELITIMVNKPDRYEFDVIPNTDGACQIMASFLREQGHMYVSKFNWQMSMNNGPDTNTCIFTKR